jgi:outer membrane protein OmpA-like peptidoglycan-associated protein
VRRIVLRGAGFNFDKAVIRPDAGVIFDAAAEILRKNGDVQVQVAGHTCSVGSEAYNDGLSRRRAQAVVDYLISRGIAADRLKPVGYGERAPVADNATKEGRVQNRRVELNILE